MYTLNSDLFFIFDGTRHKINHKPTATHTSTGIDAAYNQSLPTIHPNITGKISHQTAPSPRFWGPSTLSIIFDFVHMSQPLWPMVKKGSIVDHGDVLMIIDTETGGC